MNTMKKNAGLALVTGAALSAGSAFAQAAGGFDSAEVITAIAATAAAGLAIYGAYILGRWGIKALGLVK